MIMSLRGVLMAVAALGYVAAYAYGLHIGGMKERAYQMAQDDIVRKVQDTANRSAAEAIARIEIKNTTIRQEVQREILEKPVYRECRHDDIGLSLINAALAGPQSTGGGQLPGTDPAH